MLSVGGGGGGDWCAVTKRHNGSGLGRRQRGKKRESGHKKEGRIGNKEHKRREKRYKGGCEIETETEVSGGERKRREKGETEMVK